MHRSAHLYTRPSHVLTAPAEVRRIKPNQWRLPGRRCISWLRDDAGDLSMFDGNQWGMFQIILLLLLVMMAVQMVLDGVRGYLQAF